MLNVDNMDKELLSLDDEPPLAPTLAKPPRFRAGPVALSLLCTVVLMAAVYFAFRYGNGDVPNGVWQTYEPPHGHCSVLMPGEPAQEDMPPGGFATTGGQRFGLNRWFERVHVSFGWYDLDAERLQGVQFDQIALPLRDQELKRLNAKLVTSSTVNFVVGKRKFDAMRFQIDGDGIKTITQLYLEVKPERSRIFVASVSGRKIVPDAPWMQKFFNSLVPE